ncbi:hypothetical protein Trydic_g14813 [Trypoxylus dichotomus]
MEIAYWNAQSIRNKKNEIAAFATEKELDIILLGETFLKPQNSFKIQGYSVYRMDRKDGKGGGTAILIKHHIAHDLLQDLGHENMETTGVQINTRSGPLRIFAAYLPPGKTMEKTELQDIFQSNAATILMGDLNAKNT